ncbi:Kinesin-like protein KIN-1, partial [Mucuna pruriens]
MSNITVCARFRPTNSKEKQNGNDSICIRCIDTETFFFKDEKDEEFVFSFDRVFYEKSEQADVYQFLALPIVRDVVDAINGTVITYGQTGAGKTYSMEGPGILECDEHKKGLLPRVVEGLFDSLNPLDKDKTYSIKLSMVEIYMEKVRMRSGKLILVDLAGSEKVEKTGAEGRVLEEAKTINKSLSALGNVINSLTCGLQGKASHIPYRDSKLTRILQDALGGNARTALLSCCSPSALNASETLSTLRFGARAKHIKASPRVNYSEEKCDTSSSASSPSGDESMARILNKLREKLNVEDVKLLEELFIQEGILFEPPSVEESDIDELTLQTISSLQAAVEKLIATIDELKRENSILRAKVDASTESLFYKGAENSSIFQNMISGILTLGYTSSARR